MCRVGRDAGLVRVMGRRRWSEGESGTGHNTAAALAWGVPLVAAVGASGAGVSPLTQAERRRNDFFISLPFGTARVSPKAIMYGSASHKINSANYRKTRKFTAPLI